MSGSKGSLVGEIAVVTGGSHGIGRAVVELFAVEGASVAFCGRDASAGQALLTQLGLGVPVIFVVADVVSEEAVQVLVERCVDRLGPPTVLVNNAGMNANLDAVEMSVTDWDSVFAVDLRAAWLAAKYVLPHMRKQRRGSIINLSSIDAFATAKGFFPYGAAKAGLLGLTRSLALEYAAENIRVNAVAPGFIDTRVVRGRIEASGDPQAVLASMTGAVPLGRLGNPQEIANIVRFLASTETSYVTGATLIADGGLTARRAGE